jgi:hypothetical protein
MERTGIEPVAYDDLKGVQPGRQTHARAALAGPEVQADIVRANYRSSVAARSFYTSFVVMRRCPLWVVASVALVALMASCSGDLGAIDSV